MVVGVAVRAGHVAVMQHVVARPVEPGDDADAGQALGEVAQHAGDPVAHALVALVGRRAEPERQAGDERDDHHQRDERELDVVEEQHDGDDEHGQALQRELRQAVLQQLLERLDVARHAGHDHARLLLRVVVEGEALQVRERPHAELEHHPRRHAARWWRRGTRWRRRHHDREDRQHADDRERRPVVRGDAVVDALLAEERPRLHAERLDHDEDGRERHHPPVRPQHASQADARLPHAVRELALGRLPARVAVEVGFVGEELLHALAHLPRDARERQPVAGVARRAADRPAHRRAAGDGAASPCHQWPAISRRPASRRRRRRARATAPRRRRSRPSTAPVGDVLVVVSSHRRSGRGSRRSGARSPAARRGCPRR